MRHKVSELEGSLLDAAVAKAAGWHAEVVQDPDGIVEDGRAFTNYVDSHGAGQYRPEEFAPSTDWLSGGEIIERERIELMFGDAEDPGRWSAYIRPPSHAEYRVYLRQGGPTALIAAMRAYVASKFGETVELP